MRAKDRFWMLDESSFCFLYLFTSKFICFVLLSENKDTFRNQFRELSLSVCIFSWLFNEVIQSMHRRKFPHKICDNVYWFITVEDEQPSDSLWPYLVTLSAPRPDWTLQSELPLSSTWAVPLKARLSFKCVFFWGVTLNLRADSYPAYISSFSFCFDSASSPAKLLRSNKVITK